ncbi:cytochrome P450 [Paucibacter sp. APW11]|uniref:Cytochrome P450 n=1 Tax=Roseateles aquae TaxID=3077235 RepID=A0ABU3PBZ2_9BURK|nr:cytochrome P450 [Paucibacter sp. APW11]MDT9000077.1 cytochrome P450 [Paucibacter sp. APW11]
MSFSFKTPADRRGTMAAMNQPTTLNGGQAARPATPPGPSGFGFAQMRAMRQDYLGTIRGWQQRYGDVVCQRLMVYRDYSFFHPDHIRELLVASHDQLIRWERGTEIFASAHGQSVIVAEGAPWKRQRQMLQPGFSPKRVEAFVPLMIEAGSQAMARWKSLDQFPFEAAMTQLTMEVILRSLFSHSDEAQAQAAAEAVHVLSVVAMGEFYWPVSSPLWAPWKAPKRRALQTLDSLIRGELARRREDATPRDDLLNMMRNLRDPQGQGFDERGLRDECMTTFLAGHETTAAALSWWGWCMAAHPELQQRIADEISSVIGERTPTAADLPQLHQLNLSIKETLRLYPPGAALLTRRTTAPLQIAGYAIPTGSMIRLTPAITQRDPRWFEEPDAFRPERFDPASGHADIPRGAYLPFGAGPRVCLGSHFATTEMLLIGAMILQRYRLSAVPGLPAPRPELNITLRPDTPLQLRLNPR